MPRPSLPLAAVSVNTSVVCPVVRSTWLICLLVSLMKTFEPVTDRPVGKPPVGVTSKESRRVPVCEY